MKMTKSIILNVIIGVFTTLIAKFIIDRIEIHKMKKNNPEEYKYYKAAKAKRN